MDSDYISIILNIAGIALPVIATLIVPVISLFMSNSISYSMRKKVAKFLFSRPAFIKFLSLKKLQKEDNKYYEKMIWAVIAAMIIGIFIAFANISIEALIITFFLSQFLGFGSFLIQTSLSNSSRLVNFYKNYRIILYAATITGLISLYISLKDSLIGIIIFLILFYIPIIYDNFTMKEVIRYKREKIMNKLRNIEKSPEITVSTLSEKISGKIKDPYDKEFLLLNRDNRDIMILWEDIKLIEC